MKSHAAHVVGLCAAVGAIALAFSPAPCRANNLAISGVSLTNAGGGKADIQFTMSWENSWHESWTETGGTINVTNWDAVWLFAKYRQSGGLWKHIMLPATGHTPTGGTVIDVADDGGVRLGAFVHRNATGSGTVTCANMKLRWDLAAAGLLSSDEIDITVMGVEMVYIPEGAFYLGSGGDENLHFHAGPDSTQPFLVSSEAEISVGSAAGELNALGRIAGGPIPAAYPKGYTAFYCMKYEMTEGQYVDFLNLLDPIIAQPFFPNATGSRRNTIAEAAGGGYETSASDRPCGYMTGHRLMTYFDWCGLRPMSEFEFEKACRGPKQPWINEYAWGNASYTAISGFGGTDGSGTETATPAAANCHFSPAIDGPVRAGIFATGSSTRQAAGASYYGVMEMSGNLTELAITVGRASGINYTDSYGDGNEYTNFGPPQWLTYNDASLGGRGGAYHSSAASLGRVSDRAWVEASIYVNPTYPHGGRGVRRAP